ncbi:MAG: tetratricopeptide repeat protein [Mangrovibacterium sp.]
MSEEQKDFSEDDEQIAEAVIRFKQAAENGQLIYFDVFEYEGIIDYLMEDAEIELADRAVICALEVHPNSFEIRLKNAQILIFKGEALKALGLLDELEKIDQENIDLQLVKGNAYIQIGQTDKAIELYNAAYAQSGEADGDLAYDIALSLQQAEEYQKAIYFLKTAYNDTKNTSLLYELGYCYSRIDKYKEGIEFYERFLNEDPLNATVWYNLGINYNQIEECQKAIDAYDYAIALQESLDQAFFNKGNVLANTNRYAEAIASYLEYLELSPDSEDGHFYLADCYLATNQFEQACMHYKKAFDLNNTNIEALHNIAVTLMSDDRYESALEIMNEVLSLEQNNALYLTTFGNINYELDKPDLAEESYIKALSADKHCVVAWGALADIKSLTKNLSVALDTIREGLIANPSDPFLLAKTVIIYIELEQKEEALSAVQEGLKCDDDTSFRNLLYSQLDEDKENKLLQKVIKELKKE